MKDKRDKKLTKAIRGYNKEKFDNLPAKADVVYMASDTPSPDSVIRKCSDCGRDVYVDAPFEKYVDEKVTRILDISCALFDPEIGPEVYKELEKATTDVHRRMDGEA